jgi:hypothetical protein
MNTQLTSWRRVCRDKLHNGVSTDEEQACEVRQYSFCYFGLGVRVWVVVLFGVLLISFWQCACVGVIGVKEKCDAEVLRLRYQLRVAEP